MNLNLRREILLVVLFLLFNMATQAAETLNYTYDDAGRLTRVASASGQTLRYTYDASGNLVIWAAVVQIDSDGDGIDDSWEMDNFQSLSRDGTADFDRDGASDMQEFLSGTNPKLSTSSLSLLPLSRSGGSTTVRWQSVLGKSYRVQYKNALTDATWTTLDGEVTATSATSQKVDDTATGSTRFYRVQLVQ